MGGAAAALLFVCGCGNASDAAAARAMTTPPQSATAKVGPATQAPPAPSSGAATLSAVIISQGAPCPVARADDGTVFSIQGGDVAFTPGARFRLSGRWIARSVCQQGSTLQVDAAQPLPND